MVDTAFSSGGPAGNIRPGLPDFGDVLRSRGRSAFSRGRRTVCSIRARATDGAFNKMPRTELLRCGAEGTTSQYEREGMSTTYGSRSIAGIHHPLHTNPNPSHRCPWAESKPSHYGRTEVQVAASFPPKLGRTGRNIAIGDATTRSAFHRRPVVLNINPRNYLRKQTYDVLLRRT